MKTAIIVIYSLADHSIGLKDCQQVHTRRCDWEYFDGHEEFLDEV
jgi:hypothetical protein